MPGTGMPRWTAVGLLRRRKGCGKIGHNGQQAGSLTYIYIYIYTYIHAYRHTEHTHVGCRLETRSCTCIHRERERRKKTCMYTQRERNQKNVWAYGNHMLLSPDLCV